MEKLILQNGKEVNFNIDYNNGLPYKPLLIPYLEYGYYEEMPEIAYIKVDFSKEECDELIDKKITFNELHFIDDQF